MGDRKALSLRLYDVLERVGVSERMRQLHQKIATTEEVICTIGSEYFYENENRKIIVYFCGSNYEGTVSPDFDSDIDIINCSSDRSIISNSDAVPPGLSHIMVDDSVTYPGYVKVQAIYNGDQRTDSYVEHDPNFELDHSGKACLTHFPDKEIHGPSKQYCHPGFEFNGPAVKKTDGFGNHIHDIVLAYPCPSIPEYVNEWITRQRRYDWPSQQLLNEMSKIGCMVVPVGYRNSAENHVEWRISFSLQERLLMTSLNPIQHKVYVLLKMVKKRFIDQYIGTDSLSSYHCKTCLLYMCEMIPSTAWSAENLITCLIQCLNLLLRWIRHRYCPNYFIKRQNLFKKDLLVSLRKKLMALINNLLESGYHFLFSLDNDYIGRLLEEEIPFESISQDVNNKINKNIAELKRLCMHTVAINQTCILKAAQSATDDLAYFMDVLEFFPGNNITDQTTQETKDAIRYMLSLLQLRIGMCFGCRALRCTKIPERTALIENAESHFSLAENTDLVNVSLAQITILFQMGKYHECFLLLQGVEQRISNCFYISCPCTNKMYMHPMRDPACEHALYMSLRDKSLSTLASTCFSHCVIVLPSMSDLAVYPLQYEMNRSFGTTHESRNCHLDFWFDWAVVDAKVYLYFMQYLVFARLNNMSQKLVAFDNLHSLVMNNGLSVIHKDTAFNLLGWMCMQEQRVAEAAVCFIESWKIRPHHNAAKFHMYDLCMKLCRDKLFR